MHNAKVKILPANHNSIEVLTNEVNSVRLFYVKLSKILIILKDNLQLFYVTISIQEIYILIIYNIWNIFTVSHRKIDCQLGLIDGWKRICHKISVYSKIVVSLMFFFLSLSPFFLLLSVYTHSGHFLANCKSAYAREHAELCK